MTNKKTRGFTRPSMSGAKASLRAFTLIELLVVIAIIGLLASVVIASLNTARAKARDATRQSDIGELRSALELYANDNAGSYPSTGGSWYGNCSSFGSHPTSGPTGYVPGLAPTYISLLPLDPKPLSTTGCYLYRSDGRDYMILVYGTVETYTTATNRNPRPSATWEPDFALYTQGAVTW